MLDLILHEIRSRKWGIIGWCIGLTIFGLMYTTIYPQMEEQMKGLADIPIYEAMGVEVATFEGYVASSVIAFFPILLGVYAIMTSTMSLAGEEEKGTLELLLTSRLKRWQLVTAKAVGIIVVLTIIMIVSGITTTVGFVAIQDQITTDVTPIQFFTVVFSALPLIITLAMLGLFLATIMPSRKLALMGGLVVLIWSYFGENIGGMLDSLEGIKPFTLFNYFDSTSAVFRDGIAGNDVAILLAIATILFILALIGFQKRDVTVGNWPWQRVKLK